MMGCGCRVDELRGNLVGAALPRRVGLTLAFVASTVDDFRLDKMLDDVMERLFGLLLEWLVGNVVGLTVGFKVGILVGNWKRCFTC